jgi:hypothetical protein
MRKRPTRRTTSNLTSLLLTKRSYKIIVQRGKDKHKSHFTTSENKNAELPFPTTATGN